MPPSSGINLLNHGPGLIDSVSGKRPHTSGGSVPTRGGRAEPGTPTSDVRGARVSSEGGGVGRDRTGAGGGTTVIYMESYTFQQETAECFLKLCFPS